MLKTPDISIVIPAYNEEDRIVDSLKAIGEYFSKSPFTWEVIVVDDGSKDRTAACVDGISKQWDGVRLARLPVNWGKGRAVKEGVRASKGRYVLITDADRATPIEEMNKLRQVLEDGWDGAIGTRSIADENCRVQQPFFRKISSRVFNWIVHLLILQGYSDTQCGFKMFRREIIQDLCSAQKLSGFSFDIELLYLAKKRGCRIKEIPINWTAQPGSKVNVFLDSFCMIRDVLKIRRLHA